VEGKVTAKNSARPTLEMLWKNQLYVAFREYIATSYKAVYISSYFTDFKRTETSSVDFSESERTWSSLSHLPALHGNSSNLLAQ